MYPTLKRVFDLFQALVLLVLLSPLFLIIAICIKVNSKGPVFFRQERIGRGFRPFSIYKFRTMYADAEGPGVTLPDDHRVTKVGRRLRRYKIDELPQLFNILRGEMSFIGPRPELKRYVMRYSDRYNKILSVRPGLSDPVSLAFRHETEMLRRLPAGENEENYLSELLPRKMKMSEEYVDRMSLTGDLKVMLRSALAIFERPD